MKMNKRYRCSLHIVLILLVLNHFTFDLAAQSQSLPTQIVNGVECYVYRVQKSEGLFRISKNFATSEAVIRSFNPHLGEVPTEGMELFIPTQRAESNGRNYINHTVERRQTVFGISRMYKITEAQLIEFNPHLVNSSVREGEILRIPLPSATHQTPTATVNAVPASQNTRSTNLSQPASVPLAHVPTAALSRPADTLKIAFLLPFMIQQPTDPSVSRFIEFYAGALVAIQQAKNTGTHFEIFSFDTEKTDLKLMEVLQNNDLSQMDLIVGPAFASQVSIMGDFARINRVKTLIPFSSRVLDLEVNPYLYQFNPNQDVEIQKLMAILSLNASLSNIIFADVPNIGSNDEGLILSQSLQNFLTKNRIPFHTVTLNEGYAANLTARLDRNKENILFFNTNRISHAGVFLRDIKQLTANVDFKIYEPYAWRSSQIEKPRSFYLSFFKDEFSPIDYQHFQERFSRLFRWTPVNEFPRFDILGYDLLNYFLNTILTKENAVGVFYPMHNGIQSDIQFEKVSERGGYINKQLYHYE